MENLEVNPEGISKLEWLTKQRESAWLRWRMLRATKGANNVWESLMKLDAAYHEELRRGNGK